MFMRVTKVSMTTEGSEVAGELVETPDTAATKFGDISFAFDNNVESYRPGTYYEVNLWFKG